MNPITLKILIKTKFNIFYSSRFKNYLKIIKKLKLLTNFKETNHDCERIEKLTSKPLLC